MTHTHAAELQNPQADERHAAPVLSPIAWPYCMDAWRSRGCEQLYVRQRSRVHLMVMPRRSITRTFCSTASGHGNERHQMRSWRCRQRRQTASALPGAYAPANRHAPPLPAIAPAKAPTGACPLAALIEHCGIRLQEECQGWRQPFALGKRTPQVTATLTHTSFQAAYVSSASSDCCMQTCY